MATLDLLFIVDPLDALKAYKDSSVAMMRAAQKRGHRLYAAEVGDLWWQDGLVRVRATPLQVGDDNEDWYDAGTPETRPLEAFSAAVMRKDPPFDMEYIYATYLLEAAVAQGARVFNDPRAIRDHSEKLSLAKYWGHSAPTLVARDEVLIRGFIAEHGDAILKPLDGMGGAGIFRVRQDDPNLNVILETLTHQGSRTIMAQRYLPEISDGDKRVLLIAGEAVPFALARIPKAGETRGNLAAGGRGEARPLTEGEKAIAAALGPKLWAQGLLLVGLDVIGGRLTEINVTSPTCFVEIAQQAGFDVAGRFIDALETAVRS